MDIDRIKHSLAVANKMVEIGKEKNLSEEELEDLFFLGYVHDIGYSFGDNTTHCEIGAKILKENGYLYWPDVYYHGNPDCKYQSTFLDILNCADMSIDKYGNDVGFEKRAEDIKQRYGEESIQYQNCLRLIENIKSKQF